MIRLNVFFFVYSENIINLVIIYLLLDIYVNKIRYAFTRHLIRSSAMFNQVLQAVLRKLSLLIARGSPIIIFYCYAKVF